MKTVERMFEGPVDVVGDIHGQFDALQDLLNKLGYARDGAHSQGRKLVFVGDLVDRGPDSVRVVEQVENMVRSGSAQCVLGNHELNILRNSRRNENNWYFNEPTHSTTDQRIATTREQAKIWKFFAELPLALERDDLRVVHACWSQKSIAALDSPFLPVWATSWRYKTYDWLTKLRLRLDGCYTCYKAEQKVFGRHLNYGDRNPYDVWPKPHYLHGVATFSEARQMGNPISVLTSGQEKITTDPFPAGGKFRFVSRDPWWDDYRDEQAVIIGHYWRLFDMGIEDKPKATGVDLFDGTGPHEWLGTRKNVYCVDFSVGGRAKGHSHETCRLAALRWPEATVVFDDGEQLATDFRSN